VTGPDEGTPSWRYTAELAGEIESRWQRRWAERGTFVVPNPPPAAAGGSGGPDGEDRLYVLDMFPYPSGAGLHVGHPLGYIASDVYARFMRMRGRRVLHPFGFDAFGLPAEQYAIETGRHPAVTTAENIDLMRRQLRRLGLGHDPTRELSTADPRFYRWTQWIFLQLFGSWFDPQARAARPIRSTWASGSASASSTSSAERTTAISAPGSKKSSRPSHPSVRHGTPQAAASNSRPDGQWPMEAISARVTFSVKREAP